MDYLLESEAVRFREEINHKLALLEDRLRVRRHQAAHSLHPYDESTRLELANVYDILNKTIQSQVNLQAELQILKEDLIGKSVLGRPASSIRAVEYSPNDRHLGRMADSYIQRVEESSRLAQREPRMASRPARVPAEQEQQLKRELRLKIQKELQAQRDQLRRMRRSSLDHKDSFPAQTSPFKNQKLDLLSKTQQLYRQGLGQPDPSRYSRMPPNQASPPRSREQLEKDNRGREGKFEPSQGSEYSKNREQQGRQNNDQVFRKPQPANTYYPPAQQRDYPQNSRQQLIRTRRPSQRQWEEAPRLPSNDGYRKPEYRLRVTPHQQEKDWISNPKTFGEEMERGNQRSKPREQPSSRNVQHSRNDQHMQRDMYSRNNQQHRQPSRNDQQYRPKQQPPSRNDQRYRPREKVPSRNDQQYRPKQQPPSRNDQQHRPKEQQYQNRPKEQAYLRHDYQQRPREQAYARNEQEQRVRDQYLKAPVQDQRRRESQPRFRQSSSDQTPYHYLNSQERAPIRPSQKQYSNQSGQQARTPKSRNLHQHAKSVLPSENRPSFGNNFQPKTESRSSQGQLSPWQLKPKLTPKEQVEQTVSPIRKIGHLKSGNQAEGSARNNASNNFTPALSRPKSVLVHKQENKEHPPNLLNSKSNQRHSKEKAHQKQCSFSGEKLQDKSRSRSRSRSLKTFKISDRAKKNVMDLLADTMRRQDQFKDSKYRNVKHQLQHLRQTYELQRKIRGELIQKIVAIAQKRRPR